MFKSYSLFIGTRFFSSGTGSRLGSFISILAVTGLVLGIALLIVVLSVMNGFEHEMRTRILAAVPQMQIFHRGGIEDWQRLGNRLMQHPNVAAVSPVTGLQGMLNFHGQVQPVELQGVVPERMSNGLANLLPPGSLAQLQGNRLLMSQGLAEKLTVGEGDRVTLIVPAGDASASRIQVFQVAAVFQTHTGLDQVLALADIAVVNRLAGLESGVQSLRLVLRDVFSARRTGYELMRELPPGYSFIDWFQTHGNLYQAIQMSRKLVGLLVFLIIAIAVFNIIAMLVMTVVEKRPAIAILKTQGASNGSILRIFLVQGGLIGIAGCLLGALLGVLGALYVSDGVRLLENLLGFHFLNVEIYPIDYLPSDLRLMDVANVVAVALALNFMATLYPAWKAAKVRPAEILRYE